MLTKNPNFSHDFFCEYCKTKSNNKKDFSKHLLTAKHKKSISLTKTDFSLTEKSPKGNDTFICNLCNKIYKSRVGLWYHHKKCESQCNEMKEENKIVDVMAEQNQILIDQNKQLLEQHNDLKKMIIDICSNMKDTNINTNNYITPTGKKNETNSS